LYFLSSWKEITNISIEIFIFPSPPIIISAGVTAVGSYLPQITLTVKSAYSIVGVMGLFGYFGSGTRCIN
jgi:hypothetical protein